MSPVRTVVPAHFGSVRLVDTTYLGRLLSATPIGLLAISIIAPHERAKISYVRRPKRNAAAPTETLSIWHPISVSTSGVADPPRSKPPLRSSSGPFIFNDTATTE